MRDFLRRVKYRFKKPTWVKQPEVIQLDITRKCNLACQYCNVTPGKSFDHDPTVMDSQVIYDVFKYFKENDLTRGLWMIAPFMNGESLLDPRIPNILRMAKEMLGVPCCIDTNGTITQNRHFLLEPNLKIIRFTISAATPQTYQIVHGKPLFRRAIQNLEWFRDNKKNGQSLCIHFIATRENAHEIKDWIDIFDGYNRTIFNAHTSPFQQDSVKCHTKAVDSDILMLDEKGKKINPIAEEPGIFPCHAWNILSIGPKGEIMYCCDMPIQYNYGTIYEKDILEVWRERNQTRMKNKLCNGCSLRKQDYERLFEKWI